MLWNDLYDYWKSKHVDGRPPSRQEIDPVVEIPRLVPYLLLIDNTPEGFRYRLFGSLIAERTGLDLRGKLLGSTGFGEKVAGPWRDTIGAAFAERASKLIHLHVDQAGADVLIVFLPLVASSGETEMLLVGAFNEIALQPPFNIEGLTPLEISLS